MKVTAWQVKYQDGCQELHVLGADMEAEDAIHVIQRVAKGGHKEQPFKVSQVGAGGWQLFSDQPLDMAYFPDGCWHHSDGTTTLR